LIKKISYIASGFLLGQGSMFLALTYLVGRGDFTNISNIGISLGLLSLIQWAADGGGVFLIPKIIKENNGTLNFRNFFIARLIFSSLFYALLLIFLSFFALNNFIIEVLLFSFFVMLIWSMNATGIADYLNMNKTCGPISGLNWLFSSVAVFFFMEHQYFPYILSLSFILGLSFTVVIQHKLLNKKLNYILEFELTKIIENLKLICGFNLGFLSSQGYSRIIPILIDQHLNTNIAGMYVYSKNVSNIFSQLIQFSRRAEFKYILETISKNNRINVKTFFQLQISSYLIAISALVLSSFAYIITKIFNLETYYSLLEINIIMMSILLLWVFTSSLAQILIAKGKLINYGLIVFGGSWLTLYGMYLILSQSNYGIVGIFLLEVLLLIYLAISYLIILRKSGC